MVGVTNQESFAHIMGTVLSLRSETYEIVAEAKAAIRAILDKAGTRIIE